MKIPNACARLAGVLGICLAASLSLSGCDQFREQVATAIQPKNAKVALDEAAKAYEVGNFRQAIDEGKTFARAPGEYQQKLALTVARACARIGEVDQAIEFLSIAAQAGALDRTALMVDAGFASIATDARFVGFVAEGGSAGVSVQATQAPAPSPAKPAPAPAGVSATIGPSGVSASAGGVSVRIAP